jgi:HK97 family phage prohead protease
MSGIEYKVTGTEFKVDDSAEDGNYQGHFSVFGNVDEGQDIAHPGMFAKTLQERAHKVKVFFAHDWMKLIGPAPKTLEEDSHGLFAEGKLTLGSFWGNEVWQLMKDDALNEGSFGYETVKADFDKEGFRNLREVKLYEISPVPLGMNPLTSIRAIKAAMNQAIFSIPIIHGKLDSKTEWNLKEQLAEVKSPNQMRAMFAFYDAELPPDDAKSYRFAHHLVDGQISLKGLEDASLELMVTTDLNPTELAAAKNHLSRHYAEFEMTPLWVKDDQSIKVDALLKLIEEVNEGQLLITLDDDRKTLVVDSISRILEPLAKAEEAAPTTEHSSLLDMRLQEAELTLNFLNQ